MQTQCCKKDRVANSDYKRYEDLKSTQFEVVRNRHCLACGSHEHDGQHYTRAQWDAYVSGR